VLTEGLCVIFCWQKDDVSFCAGRRMVCHFVLTEEWCHFVLTEGWLCQHHTLSAHLTFSIRVCEYSDDLYNFWQCDIFKLHTI